MNMLHRPSSNSRSSSPAPQEERASGSPTPTVDEELERVFRKFDVDGDGQISGPELASLLESLGNAATDDELSCMMAQVDSDGDGFISLAEFAALNATVNGDDALVEEAFSMCDTDRNGRISAAELTHAFSMFGIDGNGCISAAELTHAFSMFDTDGNGRISAAEVAHALHSLGVQATARSRGRSWPTQLERLGHAATDYELSRMMAEADDGQFWLAALLESLGHAATDDELPRMTPEADGDGDGIISLDESDEEEEAHSMGAEAGVTVRSRAVTTAALPRRVTISGDRVVITIDGEVETSTGAGRVGVKRVSVDRMRKLSLMVGILGGLSDSAATAAAMYRSPRGVAAHSGEVAYRVGIAAVFLASVVQTVAACWVCRGTGTPKARAMLKKILYVSIFTLLVSIALDGVAIVLNM